MTTKFAYDATGHFVNLTDPAGLTTEIRYVPVPNTIALLALGLAGLGFSRRTQP